MTGFVTAVCSIMLIVMKIGEEVELNERYMKAEKVEAFEERNKKRNINFGPV